jgi:hypothetical protein
MNNKYRIRRKHMSTVNLSTTGTIAPKSEDQYVVLWAASGDLGKMNVSTGNKTSTEWLLSKLFNENITGVLCFNVKDAILFDKKITVVLKEK